MKEEEEEEENEKEEEEKTEQRGAPPLPVDLFPIYLTGQIVQQALFLPASERTRRKNSFINW